MRAERVLPISVILITGFLALMVMLNVILPADVFHWDESHHALYSARIVKSLHFRDWDWFWDTTHRQTLWPFLHSWVIAAFMWVFGVSYASARAANLFLFFLLAAGTFFVGRALDKDKGGWIGLLAWVFVITSYVLWSLGAQNMIEALGGLITLSAFYSLLRLQQSGKWLWIAPLGVLLGLILVTKYNYAFLLYCPFAVWALYDLVNTIFFVKDTHPVKEYKKRKKKQPAKAKAGDLRPRLWRFFLKYFLISIPVLAASGWWLLGTNREKKWAMIFYLGKESPSIGIAQAESLIGQWLFYFKALIFDYTWFQPLGVAVIIGLMGILFLLKKKELPVVLLTVFAWVPLLISVFVIPSKEQRFIYPFVPAIFLAAAYFYVMAWQRAKETVAPHMRRYLGAVGVMLMLLVILAQARAMGDFFLGRATYIYSPLRIKGEGAIDVFNYFSGNVPAHAPIAFVVNFGLFNPYNVEFHFSLTRSPQYRNAVVYRFYSPPRQFYRGMYILTVRPDRDSSYAAVYPPTEESLDGWNKFIDKNLAFLRLAGEKRFPKLGLTAQIYIVK